MAIQKHLAITDVILDFDGTCTQIPAIFEDYLEQYRSNFIKAVGPLTADEWEEAQVTVRRNSPKAGWTLGGCPAAPAAADPYILADESAKFVLRQRGQKNPSLPANVNAQAYAAAAAPWREDALDTFSRLAEHGIRIHFVSNSSSAMIQERLRQLLGHNNHISTSISVQSDAGKFRICELMWDDHSALPVQAQAQFQALPVAYHDLQLEKLGRPVYLRRGAYFEAIYRTLHGDMNKLKSTVFCGDIWEMDLAMPYALGSNVHLLDRTAPFETYPYERETIDSYEGRRAKTSEHLSGILAWL